MKFRQLKNTWLMLRNNWLQLIITVTESQASALWISSRMNVIPMDTETNYHHFLLLKEQIGQKKDGPISSLSTLISADLRASVEIHLKTGLSNSVFTNRKRMRLVKGTGAMKEAALCIALIPHSVIRVDENYTMYHSHKDAPLTLIRSLDSKSNMLSGRVSERLIYRRKGLWLDMSYY